MPYSYMVIWNCYFFKGTHKTVACNMVSFISKTYPSHLATPLSRSTVDVLYCFVCLLACLFICFVFFLLLFICFLFLLFSKEKHHSWVLYLKLWSSTEKKKVVMWMMLWIMECSWKIIVIFQFSIWCVLVIVYNVNLWDT